MRMKLVQVALLAVVGSDCAGAEDVPRNGQLALVMASTNGEVVVGDYDVETGRVRFVESVRSAVAERIETSGDRAILEHESGFVTELELDGDSAYTAVDLPVGSTLLVRAEHGGAPTVDLFVLELREQSSFRGIDVIEIYNKDPVSHGG